MSEIKEVYVTETESKDEVKKRYNASIKKMNDLVNKTKTEKNNK